VLFTKNAIGTLYRQGNGNGKKRKIAKKDRKIALLSLYLLYLGVVPLDFHIILIKYREA